MKNLIDMLLNDPIIVRMGWTLAHSLWQIAAASFVYPFM